MGANPHVLVRNDSLMVRNSNFSDSSISETYEPLSILDHLVTNQLSTLGRSKSHHANDLMLEFWEIKLVHYI
jgi:hypothetical protein